MAIIDNNWNQQDNESYEEWKQRVLVSKARKQCKMSWRAVIDLLGLDLSVDTVRHEAYGRMQAQDLQDARDQEAREAGRSTAAFSEYEEEQAALKREKMRMQDQKRELNKLLREWARAEHIQDTITAAVQVAAEANPLVVKSYPLCFGYREAALLLSDWHVGSYTDNACNTYNDAVFEQRIQVLVNKVIEYGEQNDISTLHIFNLGDMVSGLIHVNARISNTENVIQQLMKAAEMLCDAMATLANHFNITAYFARGNHDRVTPNKKESIAGESFFDLLPWYCTARLASITNINIVQNELDAEIISADILGSKILALHGHYDRPSNVIQNLSLMLGTIPDYVFMGHYHHSMENEIQGSEVIINGSLCGTDDYAFSIRKTSKPSQKLIIFEDGGRLCTYNLRLDGDK